MSTEFAIEVSGLSCAYRERLVFEGLNLRVPKGTTLGVLGPNGAGKTTLIKCMVGRLRAQAGSVRLWGHDVTHYPLWRRARLGLGYLSQGSSLIPELTVAENVALAIQDNQPKAHVTTALETLGLGELAPRKPQTLSGGQRRQVEIARLFASRAELLVLDEPYAGLDPKARKEISRILAVLQQQGRTLVVTDHDFQTTLSLVTTAIVLVDGKVSCEGNPAKILQDTFVRAHYLGEG